MSKSIWSMTAGDLMSRNLVLVPREMSLQSAARMLSRSRVTGAPVVDALGRCVGVLSATDFLHWAEEDDKESSPSAESVCHSWKIFGNEPAPTDTVAQHMTSDPVMARAGTFCAELAQMMLDAGIHRVVVVDDLQKPIGIVSSTDILAAVAREGRLHPVREEPKLESQFVG